jgi:CheY-like chemotaxis protein
MNRNAENSKFNVQVVDDDFLGRLGVGELLKPHGFQRTLAASREDALQKLERDQFDLVISVVDMPGRNGIQLLSTCRIHHPGLSVVLMTPCYDEGLRKLVISWGVSDLLRNPPPEDGLFRGVNVALQDKPDPLVGKSEERTC